jgi:hypothetical protein
MVVPVLLDDCLNGTPEFSDAYPRLAIRLPSVPLVGVVLDFWGSGSDSVGSGQPDTLLALSFLAQWFWHSAGPPSD